MNDTEEMRDVIETVVTEQFQNLRIVEIDIEPEFDEEDGKMYYFVKVIFDAKAKWPETEIRFRLTGHLLDEMEERGIDGFPIMSFIPDSEYVRPKAEAV